MWFGIFLTSLGILYLLRNLGIIYGDVWSWAWPVLLICIGIGLIIKPGTCCFISRKSDNKDKDQSSSKPQSD